MATQEQSRIAARIEEYSHYTEVRQLAYNIAALQQESMFHSLAVLSFFPGEGKTLACAALARAYFEARRAPVLIVDTTLRESSSSLALRQCLPSPECTADIASLSDWRKNGASPGRSPGEDTGHGLPLATPGAPNDFALIQSVASHNAKRYGLILLDTVPLTAKNKNNVDPLLIARAANASVLVVSKKLLDAPQLEEKLKLLEDASLHLLGLISNEEFEP